MLSAGLLTAQLPVPFTLAIVSPTHTAPQAHCHESITFRKDLLGRDSYVVCLLSFGTSDNVEFDFLVFHQRLVSFTLDAVVMNEHVRSILTGDESVAFGLIEPFNRTFRQSEHLLSPLDFGH
jgi:hypothetical protein